MLLCLDQIRMIRGQDLTKDAQSVFEQWPGAGLFS
jgi:hypothetical protein